MVSSHKKFRLRSHARSLLGWSEHELAERTRSAWHYDTVIHWHPTRSELPSDPGLRAICRAMSRYEG